MYTHTPYDYTGEIINVGDLARILCPEDLKFYDKIGTVTLINPDATIFVQMKNGGGIWWKPRYVLARPKPHSFLQKMYIYRRKIKLLIKRLYNKISGGLK